jgi:hypothetical protein
MAKHTTIGPRVPKPFYSVVAPEDRAALALALEAAASGAASPATSNDLILRYQQMALAMLRCAHRVPQLSFLLDLARLVRHPRLPLFGAETLRDIHSRWESDRYVVPDLLMLADHLPDHAILKSFWHDLIKGGLPVRPRLGRLACWYHLAHLVPSSAQKPDNAQLLHVLANTVCKHLPQIISTDAVDLMEQDVPGTMDRVLKYHRRLGHILMHAEVATDLREAFMRWDPRPIVVPITSDRYRVDGPAHLSNPRFHKFYNTMERMCAPDVLARIFMEQPTVPLLMLWEQMPELFAQRQNVIRLEDLPVGIPVPGGIIKLLAGKRRPPEPFLTTLHRMSGRELGWFVHMLRGGSLRDAPDLPFKVSRGTAQVFDRLCTEHGAQELLARSNRAATHLLFAELIASGLAPAKAARATLLHEHYFDGDTIQAWGAYCQLLVRMNMPISRFQEVCDFLRTKAREGQAVDIRRMTAESLLRRVDEWHNDRRMEWRLRLIGKTAKFPDQGIPLFTTEQEGVTYSIAQIKGVQELKREGDTLRHCVLSYAKECLHNKTAIFSLYTLTGRKRVPVITIEARKGVVCQTRGLYNRPPTSLELSIIRAWIRANTTRLVDSLYDDEL